ncbi:13751_t:CDS:2, partial [Dentiscutata heterogama]
RSIFQYLPAGAYENRIEFENARKNKQRNYALKELSKLIQKKCDRVEGIFARYGGKEFTILLNNNNVVSAFKFAEEIRASVETHLFFFHGKKLPTSLSVGVSRMNSSVETYTESCRRSL